MALYAGLLAAAAGFRAWAMVINQAVATAVVFLLFVTAGGLPLRPALDGTALRQLWPVAGPQLAAVVLMVGKYRIFLLSLGILLAETALAHANVAFRMLDAALVVVWSTVTRIAMPRLCALQHGRAALARCYGEMAQLPPLIGLPIALGVALVVEDLVAALLGPAWAGTAEAAQVAAIAARLTFLHGDQFALFVALGQARWNTLAAVANFATPLLALVVLRPETPAAPRWPGARQVLVVNPVLAWVVLRELRQSPLWLLHQIAPGIVAATAMVLAVLLTQSAMAEAAPLVRLVFSPAVGALVFVTAAWLALGRKLPKALIQAGRATGRVSVDDVRLPHSAEAAS